MASWQRAQTIIVPRVRARTAVHAVLQLLHNTWQPTHWGPSIQQRREFSKTDLLTWLESDSTTDTSAEELVVRRMQPPYYLLRWEHAKRARGGAVQFALLPDASQAIICDFFALSDQLAIALDALYGGVQLGDWQGDAAIVAGASALNAEHIERDGINNGLELFPRVFVAPELAVDVKAPATVLSDRVVRFDATTDPWTESPTRLHEAMATLRSAIRSPTKGN